MTNKRTLFEDNISNTIIINTIIIISATMILTSYFFINRQYKEFEKESVRLKQEYYANQRGIIQREVDAVIELINYEVAQHEKPTKTLQKKLADYIHRIRFGANNANYIFVYELLNINGGDNFAKMLVNPNRDDIEGKYITTNATDANGKRYREEFLHEIRLTGSSFVSYMYKKPGISEKRLKVSYFKLYKEWNWVIAAGVYLDDIDKVVEQKRIAMQKNVEQEIYNSILITLFFAFIAIFFSVLLSDRIKILIRTYQKEIRRQNQELENLNKNLELRVRQEIEKNREQEQLLIQKAKFISLGEMISNIAHQWRQPLSELSSVFMNIKMHFRLNKLSVEHMQKKTEEAEHLLEYMSHTIEDFSNFFKPNKEQTSFQLRDVVESVTNIIGSALKHSNIELVLNLQEEIEIYGYENDLEQVLLNLVSNAKDVLISEQVTTPTITITASKCENNGFCIEVADNGPGIKTEPIEKIFEPYFTTKDDHGTGIGLYMSRIILQKHMNGELKAQNNEAGASFLIRLQA